MNGVRNPNRLARSAALRWQSQAVLLAFVPVTAIWVTLAAGQLCHDDAPAVWLCAAVSVGFVALVWLFHAATAGGAITGGLIAAALFLRTPDWHTALWPLFTLVIITFAATRFGRPRKEALGLAEDTRGRRASQVAANLGVAGLAVIPAAGSVAFVSGTLADRAALTMMLAALAEAAADTVSSELGQVLGGEPRLLTTLQPVPAGTDGAITWVGTLAGCAGAAAVVATGQAALLLTRTEAVICLCAAIGGLFFDSLLGAFPERRGWLNNDAVNALSTLFAAVVAGFACHWR
ncbi:MAG: DUF92 domain-containing protein [Acidobacteriaceae bacterium]